MAIPEGYRLLNESDIGKTFGVDLETLVYFDTSVKPYTSLPTFPTTNSTFNNTTLVGTSSQTNKYVIQLQVFRGASSTYVGFWLYVANESGSSNSVYTYAKSDGSDKWGKESQVLPQYTISSLEFTTQFPNNWFYVKDIVPEEDEEEEEITNDPYTITIKNKSGITLLVEGKYLTKDITILLDKSLFGEESGGESGGTNTWSVEAVSGASYGFALNSSGYYESQNKGKKSSSAVCKVVLDIKSDCKMYVDCINYAESSYDYGLLSKLDKIFTVSATADSTDVFKSFKNLQSPNVVTVDYGTITAGSHFIYVKFIKDSSQDKDNDTLQFKVRLE